MSIGCHCKHVCCSFNLIDPNEDTERLLQHASQVRHCRFNLIDPNEDTESIVTPPSPFARFQRFNLIDPNEDTERAGRAPTRAPTRRVST